MTPRTVFWRYVFCPEAAGAVVLVMALVAVWRWLDRTPDTWPVLGRVLVPASLATFGTEHLVGSQDILQLVPAWMPARLFWAYFVGIALWAAAVSIASTRLIRVAGALLGTMFLIFVLSLHIPAIVADPTDRFAWAVALRDLVFGLAAWALAATPAGDSQGKWSHRVLVGCWTVSALVFVFFGVEHVLHPGFVPGVPLKHVMPPWVPVGPLWAYGVGMMLIASGALILINVRARAAATALAVTVTAVVPVIYVPMLVVAVGPSQMVEAINYIFDTLLFAGSVFLLAGSMRSGADQSAPVRQFASRGRDTAPAGEVAG